MDEPKEPIEPISNGRAEGGKFAPGHTFSKGRRDTRPAQLRRAALDAIDEKTVKAVLRKMAVQAIQDGDVAAARLILEFTLGKPAQAVALTDADGESLLDLARLEAAIVAAVAPFGDRARFAVALAIRGALTDAGGTEPTDDQA